MRRLLVEIRKETAAHQKIFHIPVVALLKSKGLGALAGGIGYAADIRPVHAHFAANVHTAKFAGLHHSRS